jgi:hypothetical protein
MIVMTRAPEHLFSPLAQARLQRLLFVFPDDE